MLEADTKPFRGHFFSIVMKSIVLCFLYLLGLTVSEAQNTGCPLSSVEPCICTNNPYPYLTCVGVDEPEVLSNVFKNSASIIYQVVLIESSVLQFLPYDLFEKVGVRELHLRNVTLVQLFDEAPKNIESLTTMRIENTYIFRGIIWEHLEPMVNLRILDIYFNSIDVLGNEFVQYAPKSLEQIAFYDTKTAEVKPGVFGHFPKLDKLAIDHCQLSELKRNMLSVPFSGRFLYFNENLLTSLPANMFTDMPNLQTIGLRGNSLTTIPTTLFQGVKSLKLEYLMLEGNPINCDCRLIWLVRNKPAVLTGTCFSPPSRHGEKLDTLEEIELGCS